MKTVLQLATIDSLLGLVFAGGLPSPDGLPAGYIPPAGPKRSKTDFDSIFSEIKKKVHHSARFQGDVSSRDVSPPDPIFFQSVFGPANAANNAIGYMGFVALNTYDVNACAQACNTRGFDATSGPCIYFNIWTAIVGGVPGQTVCSLYNTVTDASTATNTGQSNVVVSASRGYSRISAIQDGSFQDYTCILQPGGSCPFVPSAFWNRFVGVSYDFLLVNNNPAHSGTSSVLLAYLANEVVNPPPDQPSTLTYTPHINTVAGKKYVLSLFYTPNSFSQGGQDPLFSMLWNGVKVLSVTQPLNSPIELSLTYLNAQVVVTATGNDTLVLQNGNLNPHQSYVDDIAVFEQWM